MPESTRPSARRSLRHTTASRSDASSAKNAGRAGMRRGLVSDTGGRTWREGMAERGDRGGRGALHLCAARADRYGRPIQSSMLASPRNGPPRPVWRAEVRCIPVAFATGFEWPRGEGPHAGCFVAEKGTCYAKPPPVCVLSKKVLDMRWIQWARPFIEALSLGAELYTQPYECILRENSEACKVYCAHACLAGS